MGEKVLITKFSVREVNDIDYCVSCGSNKLVNETTNCLYLIKCLQCQKQMKLIKVIPKNNKLEIENIYMKETLERLFKELTAKDEEFATYKACSILKETLEKLNQIEQQVL